jgi:hypothetical protein
MFELTVTVTFPKLEESYLGHFAQLLGDAIFNVLPEYPAVDAYFVKADEDPRDFMVGLRFNGADPRYIEEMATEILQAATKYIADQDGSAPLDVEREDSALVLA